MWIEWGKQETYLGARVGRTEQIGDGSSSNGGGSAGSTALDRRDGRDGDLFLAEASLDVGHNGRDKDNLGNHFVYDDKMYSWK